MTAMFYYPIAACAGVTDSRAEPYDKRWLLVDAQDHWLSQSHCEKLAEVTTALRMGYLVIRGDGMLRLDIPLDVIEDDDSVVRYAQVGTQRLRVVDEGDLAAAWFTNYLGQPCRLVKVHPDEHRVLWPQM